MDSGIRKFSSQFAELLCTSNYSLSADVLQGASHPAELIEQAKTLHYRAVGIADHCSLAGIVKAHAAAKRQQIPLIVGTRLSFVQLNEDSHEFEKSKKLRSFTLSGFAQNLRGYQNLSQLLTLGKLRGGKAECLLTLEDLTQHSSTDIHWILHINDPRNFQPSHLTLLKEIIPAEHFSLALYFHQQAINPASQIVALSKQFDLALLATNDVLYHKAERKPLSDVLSCIKHGCPIDKAGFLLLQNSERYLKTPEQMSSLFRDYPQALERSLFITAQCQSFSLDELNYEYPTEVCPEGRSPSEYLSQLVLEGIERFYPTGIDAQLHAQINHELCLIKELCYEKYFLTVYDIVSFARSRGILYQGRGAAANSAVCYVLGITAVNPQQVRLLFERFISKERNEPPDIDIDFEHERREEVIQYIYRKYGRHRAALTAAVITYRTKSAVRDVAKVFNLAEPLAREIIKLKSRTNYIPDPCLDLNDVRIKHCLALSEELKTFPRHLSQHVGGFIISELPLSHLVPIENARMANRSIIEWDKNDIEELGILKIDILALGMLSCIRKCFQLVSAHYAKELALYSIPPDDPKVYDNICRADTIGVFQIESRAQMSMLPRLRPRCFYDLVIQVAIVRPGPIQGGMVHPYLRRRQGLEKVSYPSDSLRKVLEPTLGVPIFQEQVMELAVVAAGFTAGEADELRRAMGNWKINENALLKFESRFIQGMKAKGYSLELAKQFFAQVKGFGEYGFPQSHAASFAHLVYVSAWLKTYYPEVFACALLNSQPMGFYQAAQIIADAQAHQVKVLPADVSHSSWDCTLEQSESGLALRLGLRLLKGLEKKTALSITEVLAKGEPLSIYSLWKDSAINIAQLKILARGDCFNSLGINRQAALWQIAKFRLEKTPLFEPLERATESNVLAQKEVTVLPSFTALEEVIYDYQSNGLSLKAHPLSFFRQDLAAAGVINVATLKSLPDGSAAIVAGLVISLQRPPTAKGMTFMNIEDETGLANIIIRAEIFEKRRDVLLDNSALLLSGEVQNQNGVVHLIVKEAKAFRAMHTATTNCTVLTN